MLAGRRAAHSGLRSLRPRLWASAQSSSPRPLSVRPCWVCVAVFSRPCRSECVSLWLQLCGLPAACLLALPPPHQASVKVLPALEPGGARAQGSMCLSLGQQQLSSDCERACLVLSGSLAVPLAGPAASGPPPGGVTGNPARLRPRLSDRPPGGEGPCSHHRAPPAWTHPHSRSLSPPVTGQRWVWTLARCPASAAGFIN